ncbi:MAG: hypothetical protein NXI24_16165 [bacterium]|nr:hypothetical protein [bacterium]
MRSIASLARILFFILPAFTGVLAREVDRGTGVDLFESDGTEAPALRPLQYPLRDVKPTASAGGVLSQTGQAAPTALPFGLVALSNPDAEYVLFVESRESIKKDFLATLRIRHPLLELDAGHRGLPGPPSTFLGDPEARSAFARRSGDRDFDKLRVPDGRRYPILFGRIPLAPWMPGAFRIRGDTETDTGFYFASHRFLLAVGRRRGAFAFRGPLTPPGSEAPGFIVVDLERSRELRRIDANAIDSSAPRSVQSYTAHAGYGRINVDYAPEIFQADFEAERRIAWDYADFAEHELHENRSGRSGLAALSLRGFDLLEAGAAGQDRGRDGFRVGDVTIAPRLSNLLPAPDFPGRLLVRARSYRRSFYGETPRSPAEFERDAARAFTEESPIDQRRSFSAGGLGYRWSGSGGGLEIYGEARRGGGRVLQLRIELGPGVDADIDAPVSTGVDAEGRTDSGTGTGYEEVGAARSRWKFTAALAFGRFTGGPGEFLFLESPAPGEQNAGARFFGSETGALVLRLSGDDFALYMESRLDRKTGRAKTFANLQFRTRF